LKEGGGDRRVGTCHNVTQHNTTRYDTRASVSSPRSALPPSRNLPPPPASLLPEEQLPCLLTVRGGLPLRPLTQTGSWPCMSQSPVCLRKGPKMRFVHAPRTHADQNQQQQPQHLLSHHARRQLLRQREGAGSGDWGNAPKGRPK